MAHGIQIISAIGDVILDYSDKSALLIGVSLISFASGSSETKSVTINGLLPSDKIILNVYRNQRIQHSIATNGEVVSITRTNNVYQPGASDVLILAIRV